MSAVPEEAAVDPAEAGTDWSRERDGRMADYATEDDAVPTEVWQPGQGVGA